MSSNKQEHDLAKPTRSDFGMVHRLRVRWAEADIQGVVFNGNYMLYCDVAITEYLRVLAQGEGAWLREIFDRMYVKKSTLEFHAPARFDEEIDIAVRTDRIGNSSMQIGFAIFRDDDLLLTAQTVYVYAIDGKPTAIPAAYRERAQTVDVPLVSIGTWDEHANRASQIRVDVFVKEQGIDAAIELDTFDPLSTHALATLCGSPIGTGRLLPEGKIGRMAVLASGRNRGVGARLLLALLDKAKARGDQSVRLSAQVRAIPFYLRHGFEPVGPRYEEAGIEHQEMLRVL
jgi:YbgC/YbaW family acyl-CoA thioester hydrolase